MQKAGAHSQRVCAARAAEIVGTGSLGPKLIFTNRQDFLLLVLTLATRANMNGAAGSVQRVRWLFFESASEGGVEKPQSPRRDSAKSK
ncbi:MAG: hypothetical protein IM606_12965 [Cytophagales bacterium]|nr:hypothetical protein [Cytophagales bacterium]MCA6391824.1 hypothetical protein [Cytophagales bacterium]MCA6396088.1 hypothetical protein [Cytophagales bacterium]MCA6403342.1 hypothetical protein [Cytophagales bacterium]MCA6406147.1 hypothetical protein [Cytophagales bacterium]